MPLGSPVQYAMGASRRFNMIKSEEHTKGQRIGIPKRIFACYRLRCRSGSDSKCDSRPTGFRQRATSVFPEFCSASLNHEPKSAVGQLKPRGYLPGLQLGRYPPSGAPSHVSKGDYSDPRQSPGSSIQREPQLTPNVLFRLISKISEK